MFKTVFSPLLKCQKLTTPSILTLVCAGTIVFVLPYEMGQVAVTLILVMVFALFSESLAPYRSPWDAWISRIGHVVVFLSIFIAFLILYVDETVNTHASEQFYGSALVVVNICWIIAVVVEGVTTAFSVSPMADHLPRSLSLAVTDFSEDHYVVEPALATGQNSSNDHPAVERPRFRPIKPFLPIAVESSST